MSRLNRPFFTAIDQSLFSSGSRDPLGFEPIWVTTGNRIVPALTTQSLGARNFIGVLAMHYVVDRYLSVDPERASRRRLLVAFDTAYVFSALRSDDSGSQLYGIERGRKAVRADTELVIAPRRGDQLLADQGANGHLGRYARPLLELGLLREHADANGAMLTDRARQSLEDGIGDLLGAITPDMHEVFDRLVNDDYQPVPFSMIGAEAAVAQLRSWSTLRRMSHHIEEWFAFPASGRTAPQTHLVGELLENPDILGVALFERTRHRAREIEETHAVETWLCEVEALFDCLWLSREEAPTEWRQATFASLSRRPLPPIPPEGSGPSRAQDILELIRAADSLESFQTKLVAEYHVPIMDGRGKPPWAEVSDSGRAEPIDRSYDPGNPWDTDGNLILWRKRNYYTEPLRTVVRDVLRAHEVERDNS